MTRDFELHILRYLTHYKHESKRILELLPEGGKFLDQPEHQIVFDLLVDYKKAYGKVPGRVNLTEHFDRKAGDAKDAMSPKKYEVIQGTIEEAYASPADDLDLAKQEVIEQAQKKQFSDLVVEEGTDVEGSKDVDRFLRKAEKIRRIGEEEEDQRTDQSPFLIAEHDDRQFSVPEGHPTDHPRLNWLMKAGGLYAPQLAVFMAGPKSFKTGFGLNFARSFVRDGLNIYYADFDNNGRRELELRFYKSIMGLPSDKVFSNEYEQVRRELVRKHGMMGGDIKIGSYPSDTTTAKDVEADLEELWQEHGWRPDAVVWDYGDKMMPVDGQRYHEKRLITQGVYVDIANFNKRWDAFSITFSQIKQEAVEKEHLKVSDVAEDFAKIANAQAIFGICRTPEEKESGYARVQSVAQREGRDGSALFYVDEDAGIVEPEDFENVE